MNMKSRQSLSSPRAASLPLESTPESRFLAEVLKVDPTHDWRQLTHGFHTYPGRMHPDIPRRLLAEFGGSQARVLDPFLGSGTTLVETMLCGGRGFGVDVHPLAVRVARLKCSVWPREELEELVVLAENIAEESHRRARSREKTTLREPPNPVLARWIEPHIRYEIANIKEGIAEVEWSRGKDALEMILSSILVKVSNQHTDSSTVRKVASLPRGFTSRFFGQRALELAGQLDTFAEFVPPGTRAPKIATGDARYLKGMQAGSIDLVITSPPYLGTYDYAFHQRLRSNVLGIETTAAVASEIGARRHAEQSPEQAVSFWRADLESALSEMRRMVHHDANLFVLIGSSRVGKRTFDNATMLTEAAQRVGLELVAGATQRIGKIRRSLGPDKAEQEAMSESLLWFRAY